MKTVMVAIQKGGQGKTMLAVHLAQYAAKHGIRTLLLDLDVQANSSWTLSEHFSGITASQFMAGQFKSIPTVKNLALVSADLELANLEEKSLRTVHAGVVRAFKKCSKDFDLCVIDTPPTLGLPVIAAGSLADFAVAPIELETYSVQGAAVLIKILENLKARNPRLNFLGVVPNRYDARRQRLVRNLQILQEAFGDLVLPFQIPNRDTIADALGSKSNIWDIPRRPALGKQALTNVCKHLIKKMDI